MIEDQPIPARLRFATSQDVRLVLELIKELAAYERLGHTVVATEQSLQDVLFGDRPVAEVLLAEVNEEVVGFALYYQHVSTFLGCRGLFLEDLYVRPEHRGKGFGKQLLSRFAQIAQDRGCGLLEWRALDWNEPAISFYRSLGAVPMDDWTVYRVKGDGFQRLVELS